MILVVPNQIDGLSKIENNIDLLGKDVYSKRRSSRYVDLKMPKFRIESEFDLNEVLFAVSYVVHNKQILANNKKYKIYRNLQIQSE